MSSSVSWKAAPECHFARFRFLLRRLHRRGVGHGRLVLESALVPLRARPHPRLANGSSSVVSKGPGAVSAEGSVGVPDRRLAVISSSSACPSSRRGPHRIDHHPGRTRHRFSRSEPRCLRPGVAADPPRELSLRVLHCALRRIRNRGRSPAPSVLTGPDRRPPSRRNRWW